MANTFSVDAKGNFVDTKPAAPVATAAPSSAAPSAAPASAAAPAPAIPSPGDSPPPEPVASGEVVEGSAGDPTPAAPAGDTAAPAAADDSVDDPDAPGAEKRTVPYGRFSSVVAERNILRESYQHQARMIEQLTAQRAAPAAAAAPAAQASAADDAPPTLEQHEFDAAKLARAQAEWLRRQVKSGVTAEMQAAQAQQAALTARQVFESRVNAFKASKPDFDVVAANPALPPLSPTAAKLVISSDVGPAIVYHLAKHPDEAMRIARMDPEHQAMALGRLEAGLSAPTTAKNLTTSTTRAPNPPTPTSGRGNSPSVDPAKLSTKDWIAQDRKKDEERRAARRGR